MIGYLRVSTEDQADVGGGLAAQRSRLEGEAARRGWQVERWIEDDSTGRHMDRPGLQEALLLLEGGHHRGLMVAKLDRLSRSVHDATGIMAAAVEQDWSLVSLDPVVDMTTPYGKAMAQMAMVFAELERELIAMRTREAMQALRAQDLANGKPSRFGRRPSIPDEVVAVVESMARRGSGPREIAYRLNRDGFVNTAGNPWASGSVSALLKRLRDPARTGASAQTTC